MSLSIAGLITLAALPVKEWSEKYRGEGPLPSVVCVVVMVAGAAPAPAHYDEESATDSEHSFEVVLVAVVIWRREQVRHESKQE